MKGEFRLFYSSELTPIDLSLSAQLDSIPGMKLVTIKVQNKAKYLPEYELTLGEINTYHKLEVLKDFDRPKIRKLFEKFRDDFNGNR